VGFFLGLCAEEESLGYVEAFGLVVGRKAHCSGRENREGRMVLVEEADEAEELSSREGRESGSSSSCSVSAERSWAGMGGSSGRFLSLALRKSFCKLLIIWWNGVVVVVVLVERFHDRW
jgi:hypothetical protein